MEMDFTPYTESELLCRVLVPSDEALIEFIMHIHIMHGYIRNMTSSIGNVELYTLIMYKTIMTCIMFIAMRRVSLYSSGEINLIADIVLLAVLGQLEVTSLPEALFQANNGTHNVVEGSVIQLYCSVESSNATFSWTKDRCQVVTDFSHLRVRTCNDSTTTTSVLTIDNFQPSDNGTYRCMVTDEESTGNAVTLTGTLNITCSG